MKQILLASVLAAVFAATPASADDAHHPDQGKKPAATAAAPVKPAADSGKKMEMMQEHMLKMHEQMHKIMQAKAPAEREKLMQQHRQQMQDHMQMMRGGMMGSDMMGGHGGAGAASAPAGGNAHRH